MENPYTIPILFLFFNRKDVALKSFEQIKKIKPVKLYLTSDGHRESVLNEKDKVIDIRNAILAQIDWDCEVKTLFHENNLGCGNAVHTGINWLFENEEKGIILEDDCVVQNSFFPFMSELLEKYKNDDRIGMISGFNPLKKSSIIDSYCFSAYKSCWGWATWKRAWKNMDIDMKWRNTEYCNSIIENMGYHGKDINCWKYSLKAIDANFVSAWDWQWYFTLASQNQLSIFPKIGLVSNIGFGKDATHTTEKLKEKYLTNKELAFPLSHPNYILPDCSFDKAFNKGYNNFIYTLKRYTPFSIKKRLKKILR